MATRTRLLIDPRDENGERVMRLACTDIAGALEFHTGWDVHVAATKPDGVTIYVFDVPDEDTMMVHSQAEALIRAKGLDTAFTAVQLIVLNPTRSDMLIGANRVRRTEPQCVWPPTETWRPQTPGWFVILVLAVLTGAALLIGNLT